jgi:hypothetical protein
VVDGEEWCHRNPKVSAAARGKYGRDRRRDVEMLIGQRSRMLQQNTG